MSITIEKFWKNILPRRVRIDTTKLIEGWEADVEQLPGFTEAPLRLDPELSDSNADPFPCSVILVSAPGAVGKTTLAKQICAQTGGVYINLAQARTVGGYAITGGLAASGLLDQWKANELGLVIDALDEARTRITETAYEDFLKDVVSLTDWSTTPLTLFGRTGAIEHAWLWLKDNLPTEKRMGVLQIGFYDPDTAIDFAFNALRNDSKLVEIQRKNGRGVPTPAQRQAIELTLRKLRARLSHEEQSRFAGYAPVLLTVANEVASESNTQVLINQLEDGDAAVTVESINAAILEREHGKLAELDFSSPRLHEILYGPDEQLDRLSERLYGTPPPALPAGMTSADIEKYRNALETWIGEHPFLDGAGAEASSAVFDAHICLHALKKDSLRVLNEQVSRGRMVNPFLSELYPVVFADSDIILAEHVGIIYSSIRASLASGQRANLEVYEPSSSDGSDALHFAIWVSHTDQDEILAYEGRTDRSGTIRLGPYIEDVDIEARGLKVELGGTEEVNVVAPVSLLCKMLTFEARSMVVSGNSLVSLEASQIDGRIEKITDHTELKIRWEDGDQYPWTRFYLGDSPEARPAGDVDADIYMRVRRFVVLFRTNRYQKGRLTAFRRKIEHRRRTRGIGQAVLDRLIADGICRLEEPMYILDPDILMERTGLDYIQLRNGQGQDNETFVEFASAIRA